MKKIFITIALSIFSFNAYSENATYDADTKIAHIPVLEINGNPILSDVNLYLRADGLLEIVSFKEYAQESDSSSPSNTESFTINSSGIRDIGEVYLSEAGEIFTITGISGGSVGYYYDKNSKPSIDFKKTSTSLPAPEEGLKGTYYALDTNGDIAYADSLGQSVNLVSFTINSSGIRGLGEIYNEESGQTLIITGISGGSVGYYYDNNNDPTIDFYKTTSKLPVSEEGSKGAYFAVDTGGDIAYADFL